MYPSRVSGFVPASVGQAASAASIPDRHVAELRQSIALLALAADSWPGRYLRNADFIDMAENRYGRYTHDLQHAARVFLANAAVVARARHALRQRSLHSHSACSGGRAYDFQDLRSIHDYLARHPHGGGQGEHRQHRPPPRQHAFCPGGQAGAAGSMFPGLDEEFFGSLQLLIDEMRRQRRPRMSLERLISMGLDGVPGARDLCCNPDALAVIFDREVHRHVAIAVEHLERLFGTQRHAGQGFASYDGYPDILAGQPWNARPGVWTPTPATGLFDDTGGTTSDDSANQRRNEAEFQRQQIRHNNIDRDARRHADILRQEYRLAEHDRHAAEEQERRVQEQQRIDDAVIRDLRDSGS